MLSTAQPSLREQGFISIILKFNKKKNLILINENIYKSKLYVLLINKKIFFFIFIIFCFGWNPKTLITGDIATNPLWKVPYNSSKVIFGFQSFRIFEDHPLIILHRKYIE